MSVIVGRALPDVRDGLKPVHRRILLRHERDGPGAQPGLPQVRQNRRRDHGQLPSARRFARSTTRFVRMAQDFNMRYLLVDGQGNYGSMDGDSPAAMRYTEARMTKLAEEMLADIDKETVDFGPNYDESPVKNRWCCRRRCPNLLINGAGGIAVGYATNIPTHNIGEVIDGAPPSLENPDVTIAQLMKKIPGPDFPTAGFIYGMSGIKEAYETGRGLLTLRAKVVVETR